MLKFIVTGMSCAACSARVEQAVSKIEGVTRVSVNLLTGEMNVWGNISADVIVAAVEKTGYGAYLSDLTSSNKRETPKDEKKALFLLLSSVFCLIPLFYLSMAPMWNLPYPSFMESHTVRGTVLAALSLPILMINQRFFIGGTKAVFHGGPNMDTLVALGSGISYLFSLLVLFFPSSAFGNAYYFESAGMIVTLIGIGKWLEQKAKGKTTDALVALQKMKPQNAYLVNEAQYPTETLIDASELKVNDLFAVHPGDIFPADGIVLSGFGAVDESAFSGESLPVDKSVGAKVYQSTVNKNGYLICKTTKIGNETAFSEVLRLVSDASSSKAPIAQLADRVSGIFVPCVLGIACLTFALWLILGREMPFALARAISVLVISCPCSLGLATPVAIMVAMGKGAQNGILFKTATSLEQLGKSKIICFDKTGTLTRGTPQVVCLVPGQNTDKSMLLQIAYRLEQSSKHPLAKALCRYYESNVHSETNEGFPVFSKITEIPGQGIVGKTTDGTFCRGGSFDFISNSSELSDDYQKACSRGETALFFSQNNKLLGMITLSDQLKSDSPSALSLIDRMRLETYMISGDSKEAADTVAKQCHITRVYAPVKPAEKDALIQKLQKNALVAMVGDGINDAPALTRADIGIALGAGSDVALDSADIVILRNSLTDVAGALTLSRKTLKIIKENLFWAFFYNILCIPLAAGAFTQLLGFSLNPMWGALAMSLSSFSVVMNALRINLINLPVSEPEHKNTTKDLKQMTKTVLIEGMMCHHCEAHVKKALEAIPGISEALCDYEKGTCVLTMSKDIADKVLEETVTAEGYVFKGIQ